jgi:hypothetical protein
LPLLLPIASFPISSCKSIRLTELLLAEDTVAARLIVGLSAESGFYIACREAIKTGLLKRAPS